MNLLGSELQDVSLINSLNDQEGDDHFFLLNEPARGLWIYIKIFILCHKKVPIAAQ